MWQSLQSHRGQLAVGEVLKVEFNFLDCCHKLLGNFFVGCACVISLQNFPVYVEIMLFRCEDFESYLKSVK